MSTSLPTKGLRPIAHTPGEETILYVRETDARHPMQEAFLYIKGREELLGPKPLGVWLKFGTYTYYPEDTTDGT